MRRKLEMLVPAALLSAVLLVGATAIAMAASSPAVTTGTHSGVTDTSGVLHGSINPNDSATTYYFEWGLTTAYGVTSAPHSAGHGTKPVAVRTTATGLIPGTPYHYRLVATNGAGSATGTDQTFTTAGHPPPGVSTGAATQIGKNSATVTAVVNPNNQATTHYFQYGTSTTYGSQTIEATVPAGTTPVTVTASVQGLEAQTIFHYRIVALHGNTPPQPGADGTFMTLPLHRPVPHINSKTRPLHAAHKPFVLTTTGSVHGPSWIPAVYDCRGNVSIRFLLGSRRIGSTLVPLGPDCKFSGESVFKRLPGHGHLKPPVKITVVAHYLGNGYLTPHKTSGQTVALG
jgi:phosphodiesterase/alkaline phosphatase D-like protein